MRRLVPLLCLLLLLLLLGGAGVARAGAGRVHGVAYAALAALREPPRASFGGGPSSSLARVAAVWVSASADGVECGGKRLPGCGSWLDEADRLEGLEACACGVGKEGAHVLLDLFGPPPAAATHAVLLNVSSPSAMRPREVRDACALNGTAPAPAPELPAGRPGAAAVRRHATVAESAAFGKGPAERRRAAADVLRRHGRFQGVEDEDAGSDGGGDHERHVGLGFWSAYERVSALVETGLHTKEAFGAVIDPVLNMLPSRMCAMAYEAIKDLASMAITNSLSDSLVDTLSRPILDRVKPLLKEGVIEHLEGADLGAVERAVQEGCLQRLPGTLESTMQRRLSRQVTTSVVTDQTVTLTQSIGQTMAVDLMPAVQANIVKMVSQPVSHAVTLSVTNSMLRSPRYDIVCAVRCLREGHKPSCKYCQTVDTYTMDFFGTYYSSYYGRYYSSQYAGYFVAAHDPADLE